MHMEHSIFHSILSSLHTYSHLANNATLEILSLTYCPIAPIFSHYTFTFFCQILVDILHGKNVPGLHLLSPFFFLPLARCLPLSLFHSCCGVVRLSCLPLPLLLLSLTFRSVFMLVVECRSIRHSYIYVCMRDDNMRYGSCLRLFR